MVSNNIMTKLENIGSRIDMQTHAGNGRRYSTAAYGYAEYGTWSLATVRP